jgi:hypothetical protein
MRRKCYRSVLEKGVGGAGGRRDLVCYVAGYHISPSLGGEQDLAYEYGHASEPHDIIGP